MNGPETLPSGEGTETARPGGTPLVGRRDAMREFGRTVDATSTGFQFLAVVGEPGAGKSRLLTELAGLTAARSLTTLWGRAAEFEQMMPFSALIDALDDHLESRRDDLAGRLSTAQAHRLATVFPALAAKMYQAEDAAPPEGEDQSGMVRYRLYRALRQLIDELAGPAGLALILDDVHWADDSSAEFLDHLVRHPPRGKVLVAVAYRPAQVTPRLAALALSAGARGRQVTVGPLNQAEVEEFLGPRVNRTRIRALYEASGGNPFYLEALARMGQLEVGDLPLTVRAALRAELSDLSGDSLLIAQAAAVTADEFVPALAAIAAQVPDAVALDGLNELVARDIVRPAAAGRFRFRHPLVRRAAYESAAAGWQLAAHARLASHLAELGAPATVQAHHVERSGSFGDQRAIATLVEAARAVAPHAPVTASHWLRKALDLTPEEPGTLEDRLELLMELSRAQGVSGRLAEGRDTARELLRLLPADDHARRARAARICALMERQLDRPAEARALLLDELRRMPDPRAAAAIPLRMRLVAESMMRVDFRAAQAVLDLMPDSGDDWEPDLAMAVAALRPMPAFAAGRMAEALRAADAADRLVSTALDEHLAEWLDAVAWLCWAETNLGRYSVALRHFERAIAVARSTGQTYILTNLLAGRARTLTVLGRLPDARATAMESVEGARLLKSGQQLVFALTQSCLSSAWAGDHDAALAAVDESLRSGVGLGEVWVDMARHARGVALVAAGRLDEGVDAIVEACGRFDDPRLDRGTLMASCELLALAEASRGRVEEAARWAETATHITAPALPVFSGFLPLARAHAVRPSDPARAAELAREAARLLTAGERRIDAGRALMTAGQAYGEAGERRRALEYLRDAADIFQDCGAKALSAQAAREQRRLGVRVSSAAPAGQGGAQGLSPRESEIARLVAEGLTNQQIAEQLFLSVRTVETHLSRVFAKLGVTSRVGVATKLNRA
ncbi:transcriptional regulator [Sphaerisporangium krabiense]|uniref:DNA-binding CsgD family transcriptional regulator/energy-coupling factor transporter ATP-binding protein EcfA2 n=1 Tax=Sphaerisporangium krabiense TaxID=763782 RepID=A0A7W9DUU7_9ACTN|nr:AAA family ATPase [Sphaerisporangium krabiense]MBB5630760.1 DNA-binding CsgD family transcriptional regulator/energy-coupling factor transporter ATP-binding protein EcfA2 [Sphaerisporangium krabiense]GII65559.1 transcriptional regulator [Sphaerisporangium krabiense]